MWLLVVQWHMSVTCDKGSHVSGMLVRRRLHSSVSGTVVRRTLHWVSVATTGNPMCLLLYSAGNWKLFWQWQWKKEKKNDASLRRRREIFWMRHSRGSSVPEMWIKCSVQSQRSTEKMGWALYAILPAFLKDCLNQSWVLQGTLLFSNPESLILVRMETIWQWQSVRSWFFTLWFSPWV